MSPQPQHPDSALILLGAGSQMQKEQRVLQFFNLHVVSGLTQGQAVAGVVVVVCKGRGVVIESRHAAFGYEHVPLNIEA